MLKIELSLSNWFPGKCLTPSTHLASRVPWPRSGHCNCSQERKGCGILRKGEYFKRGGGTGLHSTFSWSYSHRLWQQGNNKGEIITEFLISYFSWHNWKVLELSKEFKTKSDKKDLSCVPHVLLSKIVLWPISFA